MIGVDNEDAVCELAVPPLSTVVPRAHHMGHEAAALLDTMMHGEPHYRKMFVPPQGVITQVRPTWPSERASSTCIFSMIFKDLTGTTPSQYRREHGRKLPRPFQVKTAR